MGRWEDREMGDLSILSISPPQLLLLQLNRSDFFNRFGNVFRALYTSE